MLDVIQSLDAAILLFVQDNIRCPALDVVMKAASRLGDAGLLWIVTGVLLLIFAKTRRGGAGMLASLAVEFVICDLIIKKIVLRPRPYLGISQLQLLVAPEISTSFPSGHSASSFACAYLLTRAFGKNGAWAYIPAAVIALSRVYVGVHYPSDVAAGIVLGTLVGVAMYALLRRFIQAEHTRK